MLALVFAGPSETQVMLELFVNVPKALVNSGKVTGSRYDDQLQAERGE
jgi:hypothetical protein